MSGNNWAIVVGINEYEHLPSDDHLKYAVKDAIAMQSFLCEQAQFPADNVLVCCDPHATTTARRPSRSGLRDLLRHKLQRARGADNFWFFYAGHGIVHNHQDFLLPCDGNPYDLEETAIPISFVTDCLRDCEAHNVVLVLDMCRNRTRSTVEDGSRDLGTGMGEQTLELARAQGMVTLFSCSRGQRSYEIAALEQGAFTHTLLAGLKESTTPRVLEQYLTNRVPALNQQYGKPAQVPLVVPEPGWKYDRPLLLSAATLFDLSLLATQARDAELDEDYDLAESLWWQVIEVERSTASERAGARKALQRLATKRRAQLQPQVQVELLTSTGLPTLTTFAFDVVTVNEQGQETSRQPGQAQSFTEDLGSGVELTMVSLPGGTFVMGSPAGEGYDAERPQHRVTVPPFFMGKYPVTQAQWRTVAALPRVNYDLDPDCSGFKGGNRPVEQLNWYEAVEFCDRLSVKADQAYGLPTEAEWEYACRAGTTSPFHFGKTITTDLANYDGTDAAYGAYGRGPKGIRRGGTTPVGSFPANAWGLYDLHGNVWEWCADAWHDNYTDKPEALKANGHLPWLATERTAAWSLRGGSWSSLPLYCRSAFRYHDRPVGHIYVNGFRVVCRAARTL